MSLYNIVSAGVAGAAAEPAFSKLLSHYASRLRTRPMRL